jgi:dCTP deaminase
MAFWSSETLKERIPAQSLVEPFDEGAVVHCAYELAMGPQAVITTKPKLFRKKSRLALADREPIVIPPGQFGLLLTEERITVPADALAFISIRARVKFDGLVNVSGFHVDPGFSGRLKFSVYNAGQKDIVICRGDRIFMIWFASLDRATADVYGPKKPRQDEISAEDLARASGEVASPSQLKRELDDLKHSVTNWKWAMGVFVAIASTILAGAILRSFMDRPNPAAVQPQQQTQQQTVPVPAQAPSMNRQSTALPPLPDDVPNPRRSSEQQAATASPALPVTRPTATTATAPATLPSIERR